MTRRPKKPNNIWVPIIDGKEIDSPQSLHNLIEREYPGLRRNQHFQMYLRMAEKHLFLMKKLQHVTKCEYGLISKLSREIGIRQSTAFAYVFKGRRPQLYQLIDRSLSCSQAQKQLNRIYLTNNGIKSINDVRQRLKTYYLTTFHEKHTNYLKYLAYTEIYFRSLELLKEGGTFKDLARLLSVSDLQIKNWYNGARPLLVDLARHTPQKAPNIERKWLPLTINQAYRPQDFILVPEKITHHNQIIHVLQQLHPIHNKKMQQWKNRFGKVTKEDAFYYILGITVSDAEKTKRKTSSTTLTLLLSKQYNWSELVGEATCYYLEMLGIPTKKLKDKQTRSSVFHRWRSKKSPFITWLVNTCLGLRETERTTYHSIRASWLITAPVSSRISFLQGLNDGDGCASILSQNLSNACGPNISLIKTILNSLDIHSTIGKGCVKIQTQDGIIKATNLPFFRHARQRQEKANKLALMMKNRKHQRRGIGSPQMLKDMQNLREKGLSLGRIAECIFDKYNVSLSPDGISNRLRSS